MDEILMHYYSLVSLVFCSSVCGYYMISTFVDDYGRQNVRMITEPLLAMILIIDFAYVLITGLAPC